jgi:hypothetical protein
LGGVRLIYLLLQQTLDGGYILGGYSGSNIFQGIRRKIVFGDHDYWIVKVDSAWCNIKWQNTIGGSSWDGIIRFSKPLMEVIFWVGSSISRHLAIRLKIV